jgi:hypothetical protein
MGLPGGPLNRELDAYKDIHKSGLSEDVRVGRLIGVVHEEKDDTVVGVLLLYIDNKGTLYGAIIDDENLPSHSQKQMWAGTSRACSA